MTNQHNTARVLHELVSVGGWRTTFDEDGCSQVCVDVVFKEALYGAEPQAKIRFRLSIKRAEVVLMVPEYEPLKILESSIARTVDDGEHVSTEKSERSTVLEGRAGLTASLKGFLPDLGGSVSGSRSGAQSTETSRTVRGMCVQHQKTRDGWPSWEVTNNGAVLRGSPWDAASAHRMRVRRTRELDPTIDEAVVKMEIRCHREDLHLDGLEPKEERYRRDFSLQPNRDANLAAAEQYLKQKLSEEGLRVADISDPFGEIVVADILLLEE